MDIGLIHKKKKPVKGVKNVAWKKTRPLPHLVSPAVL